MRVFAALFAALSLAFASAIPAIAQQETPPPVKGLFLLTDYPAVTVRPGSTSTNNQRLRK